MKRYYFIFRTLAVVFTLHLTAIHLQAQKPNVIDQVVWIVGDEPILLSDIERQQLYYKSIGHPVSDAKCAIPEKIAIQKLFLNQAKIDSVIPNETSINQSVNMWLEQVMNEIGGREKLEEYLGKPLSKIREERREIVREEMTVQEVQRKMVQGIKVTPSEVNRFYEKINKDSLPFLPTTVETQIITLSPKISTKEIDDIKAKLREFTEEVNSGKRDFSLLARLYSQDKASAIRGGEIGFVGKAALEPEFANVAFSLSDPQKVSRIVQTKSGYHIIQLIEKKGERINLRHILLKPEPSQAEIEKTTARIDSLVRIIRKDSLDFGTTARYASYDEDTRNSNGQMVNTNQQSRLYGTSFFAMEDLPAEVSRAVVNLKEGEISEPFTMTDKNNNLIVAVVRLKRRLPGHRANVVDDYQMIKDMVLNRKRTETLDEWIREKQKTTYVRINPEYKGCHFQYPGWVKD